MTCPTNTRKLINTEQFDRLVLTKMNSLILFWLFELNIIQFQKLIDKNSVSKAAIYVMEN